LTDCSESSCLRAVSLGTSKTPPQGFAAGFEIGQLRAHVTKHLWIILWAMANRAKPVSSSYSDTNAPLN